MKRAGFTFLELLIALSLFLIGMVSVLQVFPANRRLLDQTAHGTQAAFLAEEQLEQVRSVDYASLTVGTYLARAAIDTSSSQYGKYEREVTVTYLDTNRVVSATDQGLKKITATVYWTEHNVSQSYSVSTYVFK